MTEELLTFDIIDIGFYKITSKRPGKMGYLSFNEQSKKFVFLPEKNMFYHAIHLAIILAKLNEINFYKPKEKIV